MLSTEELLSTENAARQLARLEKQILRLLQQQCLIHSDPSISIVAFIFTDDLFHGIRQ